MTTQTSRLEIIIDTSKAKKGTDDATKSLKDLEQQGYKTEKAAKDVGRGIEETGKSSGKAKPQIDNVAKSVGKVGNEAKTTSGKMSELRAQLTQVAGDGKFGSHMQGLSTKLSGLNGSALLVGASVAGAMAGGIAVASGYLASMALEVAKNNVELSRFSAIANTSIVNFQGLAGAAATFGVTQEKTADMLKDFNEKIGEFNAIGAGGAVDFFEQIAVKTENGAEGAKKLAEEMSKMDGIDALQTYVDKLEEAGVNQKEMSFYLESMGSDLTAIAPLLVDGGQLWKDYQKAMEEAGIITGEEAIQKSIELTAQTESLQMQFGALKSELASQVMPILSALLSYFMDGSSEGSRFGGVIESIGVIAQGVGGLIVGLATGIKNLVTLMAGAINHMKIIGQAAVNFSNADSIKGKGQALWGAIKGTYNNAVSTTSSMIENSSKGFKSMSNIVNGTSGKYDALTQSIINNRKAQLDWNKVQGKGLGGGAQQNKNLFPTAKAPKSGGSATKSMNEAKRLAEQRRREAEREQQEIERARERVIRDYASKEERLLIDYNESKAEINKAFAKDPANLELYLSKAKDTYEKELAAYRSAQKDKLESFKRDFADKVADASSEIALLRTENRYGRDSYQYKATSINMRANSSRRDANEDYNRDVTAINKEYNPVADAETHYALMEEAKRAHTMRMIAIDEEHATASRDLIMQQRNMQIQAFSGLAGSLMGLVSESSSAYAALFAVQKSLNLAQAMMNGYTAISAAWASAPFPYNMGAVAMATVESGVLQAAIQAATPGFKLGGYTGNYGTSDVAGVVHGQEYVLNAEATKRVGINTLNAINNGGTIQAEKVAQASVKAQSQTPQIIDNQLRVLFVKDESEAKDMLYGPDGEKAFLYHMKRNRSKV